jgi:hypothetical protein
VEHDDVGVMKFLKYFSFVQDLLFTSLIHPLDGDKL